MNCRAVGGACALGPRFRPMSHPLSLHGSSARRFDDAVFGVASLAVLSRG